MYEPIDFRERRSWVTMMFFIVWGIILGIVIGLVKEPMGIWFDITWIAFSAANLCLLYSADANSNNMIGSVFVIIFGPLSFFVIISSRLLLGYLRRRDVRKRTERG